MPTIPNPVSVTAPNIPSTTTITMLKLKRWHAKLEEVRKMRREIAWLPIDGAVRERLEKRLVKIEDWVREVQGEVADKIERRA